MCLAIPGKITQKTFKYLEEIGELGDLTDVDEYLPKTN